jgi:DNA-binding NarL/FixJ family response regulator
MTRLPVHSALGPALRVLLVDDHRQLRQGLRGLVDGFPGIEVVGEAGDGEQAVMLAQQLQPDVILMDVQLPRLNGYDATRLICGQQSAPAVIGLSVGHIPQVEAGMLAAGARAYLCKEDAADRLYDLIRTICPRPQPALLS